MKRMHLLFVATMAFWTIASGGEMWLSGIEVRNSSSRHETEGEACQRKEIGQSGVVLHGKGTAGKNYKVLKSDVLGTNAVWKLVGWTTANEDGSFSVLDMEPKGQGFYRTEEMGGGGGPYLAATKRAALAPKTVAGTIDDVLDVRDFGANGDDGEDDAPAFKDALATARDNALALHKVIEVRVPAGTFCLSTNIPIYSNTKLKVDKSATLKNTNVSGAGIMIFANHLDETGYPCGQSDACPHGAYSQIENVSIEGGVWDANNGNGRSHHLVFQFRHGQNISIRDAVCKNAANHFINISGVSNAVVENVTFLNAATYTGNDGDFWGVYKSSHDAARYATLEAIHLDYLEAVGEGRAYPLDGTEPCNVRISKCTFQNVFAGIGTHHYSGKNKHADNIVIQDNVFTLKDAGGNCINLYGFTNVSISGNTATATNQGKEFLNSMGSTVAVNTNRLLGFKAIGCYVGEGSETSITGNEIVGGPNGICVIKSSATQIQGNKLSNMTETAIKIENSSFDAIRANQIRGMKGTGIRVASSSGRSTAAQVQDNVVECTGATGDTHGIFITDGISTGGATSIVVQGNTITKASASGIAVLGTSGITIATNKISGMRQHGIVASECPKANISGNTIDSPGVKGIFLQHADGATVTGNTIKKAKEIGLAVVGTAKAVVQDNQVANSQGHGIYLVGEAKHKTSASVVGNTSLSSSTATGTADIRFGEHCVDCVARNNTVGTRGMTAYAAAKYTETGTRFSLSQGKVTLPATTLYYNGKAVKPKVVVQFKSTTLKKGTDYAVSYKNNNGYGTATVTIAGRGKYTGKLTQNYKIVLKAPVLKSVKKATRGIKVTWAGSKGAEKYRVFRKTNSGKFAKLVDTTKTSYVDKKVKAGKKYTYTVRCLRNDAKAYTSQYDKRGKALLYK